MANPFFEHFITYTSAANIDDYLKEYAALGFIPREETVRHEPGLRNGFIFIGAEYIEFCWVEDEDLFAKSEEDERLLRASPRPFGIGLIAEDINAVHAEWVGRGYRMPEVWSKGPRDAVPDAPPLWSFQEIPEEFLPGASCFALTYHSMQKGEEIKIRIHPNTIYAISGVTFVASEPAARAARWCDLLALNEMVIPTGTGFEVQIGPHRVTWMTAQNFRATYGLNWIPAKSSFGELAVLQLFATDLASVKSRLEGSGRQVLTRRAKGIDELLITADVRDGFIFSVQEKPVESWMQERRQRTGENLVLTTG